MSFLFPVPPSGSVIDVIQSRLMKLATLFLALFSLCLTLSPIVRYQNLDVPLRWEHWIGFIPWLVLFSYTHRQSIKWIPNRDPFLLPLTAVLTGWGLVTIFRLSTTFGIRQTLWFILCMGILDLFLRYPIVMAYIRRYKYIWLLAGLLLTLLTFFFGTYPGGNGPHLWLGCCGVYFQPSEPLKLLLIAYLAAFLADRIPLSTRLIPLILPTLVLTGLVLAMLLAQRDLGTAIIFIVIYFSILYASTGRRRVFAISGLILAVICVLGYSIFDVVRLRIDSWINPWLDPSNSSYQIVQSLITIASGGILGRGTGLGNPGLVPVAQSDFIFSAIAEETGLLGTTGLVAIIALFVIRGLKVSLRATDLYRRYLGTGLTIYLGVQSLLIIGGNLNLFPLTGITLPFVSYGGSSLVTAFISLLLLLHISNQSGPEPIDNFQKRPYLQIGGVMLAGFSAVVLINSWWSVWKSSDLVNRNDNPRLSISNAYVPRGNILSREGDVLVGTSGTPGNYVSVTSYPPLSPILGYTDPIYGQAGLESSLNSYLRGLSGYSPLTTIWNQLVYSQPPPGLDIRISISLPLQKEVDSLLSVNSGAVVIVNASSGEILAMASHPYFNANTLSQSWSQLINDSQSPLLNRATQGLYPPGTALAPFILARAYTTGLPSAPVLNDYSYDIGKNNLQCSFPVKTGDWGELIRAGCPEAILRLTSSLDFQHILAYYQSLGLFSTPNIQLPAASISAPTSVTDINQFTLGESKITVSPLQMVLAAAALTSGGKLPAPVLATSVNLPDQGWTLLGSLPNPIQVIPPDQAATTVNILSIPGFLGWQTVGTAITDAGKTVTWYVGGTLPSWQGAPIAIAVLLEQNNPALAEKIGQALVEAAQNP